MARTTKQTTPEEVASDTDTTPEEVASNEDTTQEVASDTDEDTTEEVADESTDTDDDGLEEAKAAFTSLIDEVVASAAESDTGKPTEEVLDKVGDAYLELGSSRGAIMRGLLNDAQSRHTDDEGDPSLPFLVAKAKIRAEAKATSGRPAKEAGPTIGDVAPARILWALREVVNLVHSDEVTVDDDLQSTIVSAAEQAIDTYGESVNLDDLWAEGKVGGKERSLTGTPTTRGGGSSPKRDTSRIPDGTSLVFRDEHKGTWKGDGIVLADGSGPHAPSTAANEADGSTVNGWTAWKIAESVGDHEAGVTIDAVARVTESDESDTDDEDTTPDTDGDSDEE